MPITMVPLTNFSHHNEPISQGKPQENQSKSVLELLAIILDSICKNPFSFFSSSSSSSAAAAAAAASLHPPSYQENNYSVPKHTYHQETDLDESSESYTTSPSSPSLRTSDKVHSVPTGNPAHAHWASFLQQQPPDGRIACQLSPPSWAAHVIGD